VHSKHRKPRRGFTHKEKGKKKVSEADTLSDESRQSESDSETLGGGTSGEKSAPVEKASTSRSESLRRSTHSRNPVVQFGYNEYMAHHMRT
jgi:hypothetical protein